jgi:hypothetical protein
MNNDSFAPTSDALTTPDTEHSLDLALEQTFPASDPVPFYDRDSRPPPPPEITSTIRPMKSSHKITAAVGAVA